MMYACGHCGERFPSVHSLGCHMEIHTGVPSRLNGVNPGLACIQGNIASSRAAVVGVIRYKCDNCNLLINRITRCSNQEADSDCLNSMEHCGRCGGNLWSQANLSGIIDCEPSEYGGKETVPSQTDETSKCIASRRKCSSISALAKDNCPYVDTENNMNSFCKLKVHTQVYSGAKSHQCGVCKKQFTTGSYLKVHMRLHTGEKPFKCEVCKKQFIRANNLNVHMRVHTGEKPYQCEVCKKLVYTAGHLKLHMRIHTGEKPYNCEVCKKRFTTRGSLKVHIMRLHTGEKPYQCEVCKKRFTTGGHLKVHMRYHTGEKPYRCEVCEKLFYTADHLKVHMRIHTGEKPYKCEVCKKQFGKTSGLTVHIRVHTGEKPYQCEVCMKQFSQYSRALPIT